MYISQNENESDVDGQEIRTLSRLSAIRIERFEGIRITYMYIRTRFHHDSSSASLDIPIKGEVSAYGIRHLHISRLASHMMDALAPFKTYQPSTFEGSPLVHSFFDNPTSTWTFVVVDPPTKQAMIIDSVLDFEPASGSISTQSARGLVSFVEQNNYEVTRIMETHVHADHATAAFALKQVGTPSGKIFGC